MIRLQKRKVWDPCGITSIFCGDTSCTDRRNSRPFSAMTTIFVDLAIILEMTLYWASVGAGSTV